MTVSPGQGAYYWSVVLQLVRRRAGGSVSTALAVGRCSCACRESVRTLQEGFVEYLEPPWQVVVVKVGHPGEFEGARVVQAIDVGVRDRLVELLGGLSRCQLAPCPSAGKVDQPSADSRLPGRDRDLQGLERLEEQVLDVARVSGVGHGHHGEFVGVPAVDEESGCDGRHAVGRQPSDAPEERGFGGCHVRILVPQTGSARQGSCAAGG